MLSGEPYAGKTLFSMYLLLHMDLGLPLFGRFQPLPHQRCLFIGQDAPTWDYHGQFLKLLYGLHIPSEDTVPLPSFFILNQGLSLVSHDFIHLIRHSVSLYDINVLFLDTLADFHHFEENSNTEMNLVMRTLKYLRDTFDLSIIFTHHVSKPSANSEVSMNYRARGASKIAGSIDQHIYLSSKMRDGIPTVSINFPKARGIDNSLLASLASFDICSGVRKDGRSTVELRASEPPFEDSLLAFLITPRSRAEIESFCGSAHRNASAAKIRSLVSRLLDSLRADGRVVSPSHGVWQITGG